VSYVVDPALPFVNSGTALGRAEIPIMLDRQTPSAVSTVITATFVAGSQRKIILTYKGARGPADMYFGLRFNADSGTNYIDLGALSNSAPSSDSSPSATLGYARLARFQAAAGAPGEWRAEIDPRTDGLYRTGRSRADSFTTGVIGLDEQRTQSFAWTDTATNVTFFTIIATAGSMTGVFEMWGVPS
jgi:hypothetical protein